MLFEGGADVIPYALEGEIVIFIVITSFIWNFGVVGNAKKVLTFLSIPNLVILNVYLKCLSIK